MHRLTASFVLAYHGCDKAVAEKLLLREDFKLSQNEYDWLGTGIYFWEANPIRGLEFAKEVQGLARGQKIEMPAVVGAVVELGLCLDLTTSAGIQQVKDSYPEYVKACEAAGYPLLTNSSDQLRRPLDCAVINLLHEVRIKTGQLPIDTVRGVFVEGEPIYDGAGIRHKTHIQICVCNPECIKGIFRVPEHQLS